MRWINIHLSTAKRLRHLLRLCERPHPFITKNITGSAGDPAADLIIGRITGQGVTVRIIGTMGTGHDVIEGHTAGSGANRGKAL